MANPIQLNHVSGTQMNSKSENQSISIHCLSQGTVDAEEIPGDAEGTVGKKGYMVGKNQKD